MTYDTGSTLLIYDGSRLPVYYGRIVHLRRKRASDCTEVQKRGCVYADAYTRAKTEKKRGVDDGCRECNTNYMGKRRKKNATMTELLRDAIANAESIRGIQTATGVKRAALTRFRDGKQSLRLDMADKLAVHFGIECSLVRQRKK